MAYFGESLTGVASKWFIDQKISHWHIWDDMTQDFVRQFQYNVDIMPDRNTLSNTRKKQVKTSENMLSNKGNMQPESIPH